MSELSQQTIATLNFEGVISPDPGSASHDVGSCGIIGVVRLLSYFCFLNRKKHTCSIYNFINYNFDISCFRCTCLRGGEYIHSIPMRPRVLWAPLAVSGRTYPILAPFPAHDYRPYPGPTSSHLPGITAETCRRRPDVTMEFTPPVARLVTESWE